MTEAALIVFMILIIGTPLLLHFGFKLSGKKMKYAMVSDIVCFAAICVGATIYMLSGGPALAEGATVANSAAGYAYIAAALATGLAAIAAGVAVASSAAAAIGAISEDPAIMGKALIFVALAEGIALYGLLTSFMILGKV